MTKVAISPEALEAATERLMGYKPGTLDKWLSGEVKSARLHQTRGILVAFCEAEGLTVEDKDLALDLSLHKVPEQRIVGPWKAPEQSEETDGQ